MPIGRSAKKSLRKSISRRNWNLAIKKSVREAIKKFLTAKTDESFKKLVSTLDKAAKNGIFHQNKVARLKSKYSSKVKKVAKKVIKKKVAKSK